MLARYRDRVTGHEMLEEKLLLYADDGESLLHDLTGESLENAEFYARRATLEDVFLELTGRTLTE